jgi:uncharacterized protein
MRWTIQELVKQYNTDNTFEETIDFSEVIKDTDILKISPVEVKGDYEIYDDNQEFVFYMEIKCTLTMACAITLKEVEVELDFDVEETFTTYKTEEFNTIEGITIDLLPILWSNIILEKPMRVVSPDATSDFEQDNIEFEDENINNAFAKLKDFKN